MDDCTDYLASSWEIVMPSSVVFNPICVIRDKTNLFLISCIRLAFYIFLLKMAYDNEYNSKLLLYFLLIMISINVLYLVIVILKKPAIEPRNQNTDRP